MLFRGTDVFDEWFGSDEADQAYGFLDADRLYLGLGDDAGYGGQGNDTLDGNVGDDYLAGGAGSDQLYGGVGQDVIAGGRDDDVLFGGEGQDHLEGSTGNDYLNGHGTLIGGRGVDYLYTDLAGGIGTAMAGGRGADAFVAVGFADYSTTVAEVTDFGRGDEFSIWCDFTPIGGNRLTQHEVFAALDVNADHRLDATDGPSWLGTVASDGRDLYVVVSDDYVVFRNVQALTDGQLYG